MKPELKSVLVTKEVHTIARRAAINADEKLGEFVSIAICNRADIFLLLDPPKPKRKKA